MKLPRGHEFGTEHADRCSIPSLADCLSEINVDWINDLGRWGLIMSQTYIRAHLRRVADIQCTIAFAVRKSSNVVEEFDEHDVYTKWASFLCAQGSPHGDSVKQAADLMEAGDFSLRESSSQVVKSDAGANISDEAIRSAPSTPPFDVPGEGVEVQSGLHTVSINTKTGFRRLHQVGNCPLVPGADYACFEVCGEEAPEASAYDAHCKHCFGGGMSSERGAEDVGSGSSSESS